MLADSRCTIYRDFLLRPDVHVFYKSKKSGRYVKKESRPYDKWSDFLSFIKYNLISPFPPQP